MDSYEWFKHKNILPTAGGRGEQAPFLIDAFNRLGEADYRLHKKEQQVEEQKEMIRQANARLANRTR